MNQRSFSTVLTRSDRRYVLGFVAWSLALLLAITTMNNVGSSIEPIVQIFVATFIIWLFCALLLALRLKDMVVFRRSVHKPIGVSYFVILWIVWLTAEQNETRFTGILILAVCYLLTLLLSDFLARRTGS